MVNTYKIREVTVTIPKIGIISSDKEGNEFKCGEIYHINLFAMRPGWQTRTSDFDGLIVGRLDFSGYTESPYSRTQKIIMPNGYELVALRVGECGRPMTWESLPVVFSDAPLSDSEPFTVKNGEVFIKEVVIGDGIVSAKYNMKFNINNDGKEHAAGMSRSDKHINVYGDDGRLRVRIGQIPGEERVYLEDAKIGDAVLSTNYSVKVNVDYGGKRYAAGMHIGQPRETQVKVKLGDEMKQAVIDAVRESDLFASLQASVDAQTASVTGLQQAVHDAVNDALRNALKPGGAVWAALPRNHGRLDV